MRQRWIWPAACLFAVLALPSMAIAARWHPEPTTASWQWQLQGKVDTAVPAEVFEAGYELDPSAPMRRRASSPGSIVVHGADSGSHLTLAVSGSNIVVRGLMSSAHPAGCRFPVAHLEAICPLADETVIEADMGPSGDFVEVLNRLPLPLTVHLGSGEDKFIGNGEKDTCYGEGSRRNRCVGGAGNDVCITGPRNSDCVGGAGNDFCKASSGSDGCWGGPGRDVCYMGSGEDGCHGEGGNDRLYGGPDPDQLYGGPGFNYCNGGPGIGRSHECESGPGH